MLFIPTVDKVKAKFASLVAQLNTVNKLKTAEAKLHNKLVQEKTELFSEASAEAARAKVAATKIQNFVAQELNNV